MIIIDKGEHDYSVVLHFNEDFKVETFAKKTFRLFTFLHA